MSIYKSITLIRLGIKDYQNTIDRWMQAIAAIIAAGVASRVPALREKPRAPSGNHCVYSTNAYYCMFSLAGFTGVHRLQCEKRPTIRIQ